MAEESIYARTWVQVLPTSVNTGPKLRSEAQTSPAGAQTARLQLFPPAPILVLEENVTAVSSVAWKPQGKIQRLPKVIKPSNCPCCGRVKIRSPAGCPMLCSHFAKGLWTVPHVHKPPQAQQQAQEQERRQRPAEGRCPPTRNTWSWADHPIDSPFNHPQLGQAGQFPVFILDRKSGGNWGKRLPL